MFPLMLMFMSRLFSLVLMLNACACAYVLVKTSLNHEVIYIYSQGLSINYNVVVRRHQTERTII